MHIDDFISKKLAEKCFSYPKGRNSELTVFPRFVCHVWFDEN